MESALPSNAPRPCGDPHESHSALDSDARYRGVRYSTSLPLLLSAPFASRVSRTCRSRAVASTATSRILGVLGERNDGLRVDRDHRCMSRIILTHDRIARQRQTDVRPGFQSLVRNLQIAGAEDAIERACRLPDFSHPPWMSMSAEHAEGFSLYAAPDDVCMTVTTGKRSRASIPGPCRRESCNSPP